MYSHSSRLEAVETYIQCGTNGWICTASIHSIKRASERPNGYGNTVMFDRTPPLAACRQEG